MESPIIRRALVSVSDKSGLAAFCRNLVAAGVEIYSSGGTRTALEDAGIDAHDISAYTGFPELLDGRLKTLHPKVHGGILCRHDRPDDVDALRRHGIHAFELVVVNLYPFEATVARPEVAEEDAIEQIDIGGPTLIRAAAKNYKFVTVATDPSQYDEIAEHLRTAKATTYALRRRLAVAAFARTTRYDDAIERYFTHTDSEASLPETWRLHLHRRKRLRYGENPHQVAALYTRYDSPAADIAHARQLNGKDLSYNNLLDLDSAWTLARSLPSRAVVVIKHNNPCGAACGDSLQQALRDAWDGDPESAFGSVLAMNQAVDPETAEALAEPGRFVEAIVAPGFDPDALRVLTTKPKWKTNVRLLAVDATHRSREMAMQVTTIDGGYLVQERDDADDPEDAWRVVTETAPDDAQWSALRFAWTVCRRVKSNAIVVVRQQALVGVGGGQMSRVDAVQIALRKAGPRSAGSVLASDAFFPFDDSIRLAADAGVAAIIQPGGSRRDQQVIVACNAANLPMVFTGRRHFWH